MKRMISPPVSVLAKIFCICPWFDSLQAKSWKTATNKITAVLCLVLLIITNVCFLRISLRRTRHHPSVIEIMLEVLRTNILILLGAYQMIGTNLIKREKWESLLKSLILALDMFDEDSEKKFKRRVWLRSVIGHIILTLVFICLLCDLYQYGPMFILLFSVEVIDEYFCFLTSLLACNFVSIMENRYSALEMSLKKLTKNINILQTSDESITREFLKVGSSYTHLHEMISNYNEIFGWSITLIFAHSIVQLLRLVNVTIIISNKYDITWDVVLSLMSLAIVSLVSKIFLLLAI